MSNTTSNRIIAVVPVAYTQTAEDGKTEDVMVLIPVCSPEDSAKLPHADVVATIIGNEKLADVQVEALGAYTLALQDDILSQSNTKLEGEALTTAQQSIFQAELEILEAILSKAAAEAATATPEVTPVEPATETTAEEVVENAGTVMTAEPVAGKQVIANWLRATVTTNQALIKGNRALLAASVAVNEAIAANTDALSAQTDMLSKLEEFAVALEASAGTVPALSAEVTA